MRILFVNQYYPPDVSATAYLLGELAEDLGHHHDVWVIAGRPSYNPEVGTYQPSGVRLHRTWSTSLPRRKMAGRAVNYCTFLISSLVGVLGVRRPDVIVGMTDPPFIGLIAVIGARFHRSQFVYVCEDVFPDVGLALGHIREGRAAVAWRKLNRLIRRNADQIVAIGRDMAEKLEAEGVPQDRITFIPNWADRSRVRAEEVRATRERCGWEDRFVVMHAGNVGLAQNLGVLIKAAERLRSEPDFLVAIVGDGAARQRLEMEVKERRLQNVVFLPYVPKTQVQDLIAAADVHVVTLASGLWGSVVPSKIYGILAAARPFIAAVDEDAEPHRIIKEAGCGIRVPPNDPEALAAAVIQLHGSGAAREMGERGKGEFEGKYVRSVATERYREMFESLTR